MVVSNAVVVLKSLVQTQMQTPSLSSAITLSSRDETPALTIIDQLARRIDDIRHSEARACVLWLVGQYAEIGLDSKGAPDGIEGIVAWAPDVLRKAAKTFTQEVCLLVVYLVTPN